MFLLFLPPSSSCSKYVVTKKNYTFICWRYQSQYSVVRLVCTMIALILTFLHNNFIYTIRQNKHTHASVYTQIAVIQKTYCRYMTHKIARSHTHSNRACNKLKLKLICARINFKVYSRVFVDYFPF